MDTCKRAMDNLDFLSHFRLFTLLDDIDPLLKGWVAQHTKLHHFTIGYFHRTISIPVFQNVKGSSTLCQQRTKLFHRHLQPHKHVIMDDGYQDPAGFGLVTGLSFRISHRNKARQSFLLQEVTHNHLMSVEGANHHPNLFCLLHFLSFLRQGECPTRSNLTF